MKILWQRGRLQVLWYGWAWRFGRGIWPRASLPIYRWRAVGPVELRRYFEDQEATREQIERRENPDGHT